MKKMLCAILTLCMVFAMLPLGVMAAEEVIATGTINVQESLNVREGPGTSYAVVGTLGPGDRVEIYEIKNVSGTDWGRIDIGWISMAYVDLDPDPSDPGDLVDSGTCGDSATWAYYDSGMLIISGSGAMNDYPHSASKERMKPWVYYEEEISSVVIEEGITYIGTCTFCDCTAIQTVRIPDTVTAIGSGVFSGCISLREITVPDSVTTIDSSFLQECESLTKAKLSKNLTEISIRMFDSCTALAEVEIPEGVTTIRSSGFYNCWSLTEMVLPESLTTIDQDSLTGCSGIKKIIIPKNVTSIGRNAFQGWAGLMNIAFVGDAPDIDDSAFRDVVTNAYYPINNETWTVDVLQDYGGTINWYGVEDPANTDMPTDHGTCGTNTTWALKDGVLTISGSGEIENIPWKGLRSQIEEVVIEDGVTNIHHQAFYMCENLSKITIADSVTWIGTMAFAEISNLTAIDIPDGVTTIYERAFDNCDGLKSVALPASLKELEYRVFFDCDALASVTMPDGVESIGEGVFRGCVSLKSVTIPGSVTFIDDYAFIGCTGLTKIRFEGAAPKFGGSFIFEDVTATVEYPADRKGWDSSSKGIHYNCNLTWHKYCSGVHDNYDGTVIEEATCTEPGTASCVCSVCEKEYTAEIPAAGHSYDGGVVTDATCVTQTHTTYTCEVCGHQYTDYYGDLSGHDYDDGVISTEPTCTEDGVMTYTCTVCGDSYTEAVPAAGHSYDEGTVTTEPTCTDEGVMTFTCIHGDDAYTEAIPALGHSYDEGVTTTQPTCTEEGITTYTCTACGDSYTEAFPANGHSHNDGEVTLEPTCTSTGVMSYVCTVCGEAFTEEIPINPHNFVDGACSECGASLAAPEILSCYSKLQTSVKVTWTTDENADGYELYRTTTPDDADSWTRVKTITSGSTDRYTNQGLEVGTTYYYKVRAFAEDAEGNRTYTDFSNVDYMPAAVVFDGPYSNATFRIRLRWNQVGGSHGYQIWRQNADGSWNIVKTLGDKGNELTNDQGATTAYSNTGLTAGETYVYKMRSFMIKEDGRKVFGAYSDEYAVAAMPEAPVVTGYCPKATRAELTWDAVNGAAGYQVWMAESADGEYRIVKSLTDGSTICTKHDLTSGKTYYFKVRAYTEVEGKKTFGAYSEIVSVDVQ